MPFDVSQEWLTWLMAGLFCAAAAFVLFLLAVLYRAGRIRPREAPRPRRPEYSPHEARRAGESLSQAVSFGTVSHPDSTQRDYNQFVALRRFLRGRYPLCHEKLEFEQVAGFSMLFCWRAGAEADDAGQAPEPPAAQPGRKGPVMLCGHLDVVPAGDGWKTPPFEGRAEDGYVWGRGALDCKSNVVCIFEAIESLLKRGVTPQRDVYLAFGHDEELGGEEGARQIARLLASRGVYFDMILDEGTPISDSILPIGCPVAEIGVSEKGCVNLRFSAAGEGGHTAIPPAHSSLSVLSEALGRLNFKPRRARLTPVVKETLRALAPYLSGRNRMMIANLPLFRKKLLRLLCESPRSAALVRSTVTPVMSTSGIAANMLPERSEAILNVRLLPGDTEKILMSWLDALTMDLGLEIDVLMSAPPSRVSDYNCEHYRTLSAAIGDVFHEIPVVPALCCMASDARYYEPLCSAVYRFSPFILPPDDLSGIHGSGEKVATVSLGAAVHFYRRLLERLCLDEAEWRMKAIDETIDNGQLTVDNEENEDAGETIDNEREAGDEDKTPAAEAAPSFAKEGKEDEEEAE